MADHRRLEEQVGMEAPDGPPRSRSLVLPCVDARVHGKPFEPLCHVPDLELLPIALPSTLQMRAQRERPEVIVLATEDFAHTVGGDRAVFREVFASTPTLLLTPDATAVKRLAAHLRLYSVLPMHVTSDQLCAAVKAVAAGLEVAIEEAARGEQHGVFDADQEWDRERLEPEHLTAREVEVLRLMALGCGNKEVAGKLHISEHTAKFHVRSILAKLGAASRTEAVSLGILHGLIAV